MGRDDAIPGGALFSRTRASVRPALGPSTYSYKRAGSRANPLFLVADGSAIEKGKGMANEREGARKLLDLRAALVRRRLEIALAMDMRELGDLNHLVLVDQAITAVDRIREEP